MGFYAKKAKRISTFYWIIGAVVVGIGCALSVWFDEPLHLARSGSVVVVIALTVAYYEFSFDLIKPMVVSAGINTAEQRLDANMEQLRSDREFTREEAMPVKKRFLSTEFGLGILGTLVWGFGDTIMTLLNVGEHVCE